MYKTLQGSMATKNLTKLFEQVIVLCEVRFIMRIYSLIYQDLPTDSKLQENNATKKLICKVNRRYVVMLLKSMKFVY